MTTPHTIDEYLARVKALCDDMNECRDTWLADDQEAPEYVEHLKAMPCTTPIEAAHIANEMAWDIESFALTCAHYNVDVPPECIHEMSWST